MKKSIWALGMVIVMLALAGCSPVPVEVLPTELPTPAPTVPPTPVPTAEPSCPEPTEGTQPLRHDEHGYCLLYPAGLVQVGTPPHQVCLIPEGPSMACHSAVAFFEVTDAGGRSASELADEKMTGEGGFGPERESLTIAGVEAVVLPEVGGQVSTRQVWFVHDDRLVTLSFVLPDPEDPAGVEQFERLYDMVTTSFTLLPVVLHPVPAAPSPEARGSAVVVFVKEGDLLAWYEATGQTETIYDSGDVIQVRLSDDSQLVAFVRRTLLGGDPRYGQSALWVVEQNGANPRELVSDEQLRARLGGSETDDTSFPGLQWIPDTHRLLYSVNLFPANLYAQGLNLIDVDTLATAEIIPAEESVIFAPSPDGEHIALMNWPVPEAPFFVNVDESLSGQVRFIHPSGAVPSRDGLAWTQDSTAFLARAFEPTGQSFTIWRLPLDRSPATLLLSHSGDREQLAPDGSVVTFMRSTGPLGVSERFVLPLPENLGPLAVLPNPLGLSWSPGGTAYIVGSEEMVPLCPHALQAIEVCEPSIRFSQPIQSFQWLDRGRFLYLTHLPRRLMLGSLDGWAVVIAEDPQEPLSFDAVASSCRDDAEFLADVTIPDGSSIAADSVFRKTWRIRNSGTCAWDASYRLAFLSGDRMSGPRSAPLARVVQPGEEADLSVTLIAPASAGTYQGQWQLFSPDGTPFGTRPFVMIQVP